jgi:hypothetical protein
MSEQDGGSAFPVLDSSLMHDVQWNGERTVDHMTLGGMSLRDYFAIRAPEPTPEYITSEGERDRLANPHGDSYKPARRSRLEIIAGYRYAYADAMLAQRSKP